MLFGLIKHQSSRIFKILTLLYGAIVLTSCSTKNKSLYPEMTSEQIYKQGKLNLKNEKFSEAVKDFEALETEYPYGEYADRAKLSLIYAYYAKQDYPQVKAVADRLLKMHPNYLYADYVHYMHGVASYNQYYSRVFKIFNVDRSKRESSLALEAFDAFKKLLERFPKSKYAADARQRMLNLRNQLASNELHIAKYYFMREAYLAAANRAYMVITNFNGTSAVEEALQIMRSSYNKLNMPELERNAVNLINNFKTTNNLASVKKE